MGQQQKFSWFLVACRSNEKNICVYLIIIFFAVELVELRVRYKLEFEFEFDITNHLSNVIKQCRVFEIEKKLGKAIL